MKSLGIGSALLIGLSIGLLIGLLTNTENDEGSRYRLCSVDWSLDWSLDKYGE